MRVEKCDGHGVTVDLEPEECELFVRLARDAEKAGQGAPGDSHYQARSQTYFSVSLSIGQRINALLKTAS